MFSSIFTVDGSYRDRPSRITEMIAFAVLLKLSSRRKISAKPETGIEQKDQKHRRFSADHPRDTLPNNTELPHGAFSLSAAARHSGPAIVPRENEPCYAGMNRFIKAPTFDGSRYGGVISSNSEGWRADKYFSSASKAASRQETRTSVAVLHLLLMGLPW